jgi:ketosteroid isomerase-like protein
MTKEKNKKIVQQYFDVVTGKSHEIPLEDFFAPNVEWHVPQSNPAIKPNPKVGHAAVMDLLSSGVNIYQPESMEVVLDRLIADEYAVAAQFTLNAKLANGNDYHNQYFFLFSFENGKIDGVWEYLDTLYQWRQGTFE